MQKFHNLLGPEGLRWSELPPHGTCKCLNTDTGLGNLKKEKICLCIYVLFDSYIWVSLKEGNVPSARHLMEPWKGMEGTRETSESLEARGL